MGAPVGAAAAAAGPAPAPTGAAPRHGRAAGRPPPRSGHARAATYLLQAAFALLVPLAGLVCRRVPAAYMDEIFHVPQAQRYCAADYSAWDPKITTFPGLYLLAAPYARAVAAAGAVPALRGLLWPPPRAGGPGAAGGAAPAGSGATGGGAGSAAPATAGADPSTTAQAGPDHATGGLEPEFCSLAVLRSFNVAASMACLLIFHALLRRLHPSDPPATVALRAAALALFPLHFFFAFLFYTDVASAAAILLAYLLSLHNRPWAAGLAAGGAVLMRQTNAVWAAFLMADLALRRVRLAGADAGAGAAGAGAGAAEAGARGGLLGDLLAPLPLLFAQARLAVLRFLYPDRFMPRAAPAAARAGAPAPRFGPLFPLLLVWDLLPLAAVCGAFAAFALWNGGVVVGDKAAHAPAKHWAQPLYGLLFAAGALAPTLAHPQALAEAWALLSAPGDLGTGSTGGGAADVKGGGGPDSPGGGPWAPAAVMRAAGRLAALTAMAAAIVRVGTLAHPYLLADNRHYTFYLWKDIINRHPLARYAFAPAYAAAAVLLAAALLPPRRPAPAAPAAARPVGADAAPGGPAGPARSALWAAALAAAAAATLVPAGLLELRYFTVPVLLVSLHVRTPPRWALLAQLALYAALNAATLGLFVQRPFVWPDGSVARFLW